MIHATDDSLIALEYIQLLSNEVKEEIISMLE